MVPDGWTERTLGVVLEFKNGINTDAKNYGSGVKFVNVMDIFGSTSLTQEQIRGSVQITNDQLTAYALQRGDVLFNRTSETREEIAFASVYLDDRPAVFGGFIIRGRPKKRGLLDPDFSKYCFTASRVREELVRRCQGAIRANIGQADMAQVRILLPPLVEQARIAHMLGLWDRAIQTAEQLLENSTQQRNALIYQLVWGRSRFRRFATSAGHQITKYGAIPSDWGFPPIAETAEEVSTRNERSQNLPVLACSKYAGFVNSLEYFKKKVYSDDTSNYKVVPRGTFGFPSNHIEEGSIGYQDICDAGLVSPIYCLFRTNDSVCDGYLYRLLKTDHYRQIFSAATNSSVDRRGSLRWKDFSAIHVPLPPLEEQQAISRVIDVADQETVNLAGQLESLRSQRTALMQQLLTGKRRVRVDEGREEVACA